MGNAISEKSCSFFFYFRELNSHLQQKLEDTSLELQEVRSLCNAATVERDRLAELVEVLQKRFFFVLRACLFFTVSCLVSGAQEQRVGVVNDRRRAGDAADSTTQRRSGEETR